MKNKPKGRRKQASEKREVITANTPYNVCEDRLTAYGGLHALNKVLDLIDFKAVFEKFFVPPKRCCELGNRRMLTGFLMLLFIGFQRLGHFEFIRQDPLVCGILKVAKLPVASTFWRYLRSLCIVQSESLLRLAAALRKRLWAELRWAPEMVSVDIDTTTATVYGNVEGGKVGYNTKHRGKKGLRPILLFIAETREYLGGALRRGSTLEGREAARHIRQIRSLLPSCVQRVLIRADGEMMCQDSVKACENQGFSYILANKRCTPDFPEHGWYRHGEHEYNECLYQPMGWDRPRRFVVMRISQEQADQRQLLLPQCEGYAHRIFVTNLSDRPHKVVACYDRRAAAENLIGEAQREGVLAIPSNRFHANHAFFQIVMLAYNLWRWTKLLAGACDNPGFNPGKVRDAEAKLGMPDHTNRLARLKLLFVAAKIQFHAGQNRLRFSIHYDRAQGLMRFLRFLDKRRKRLARAAHSMGSAVQEILCTNGHYKLVHGEIRLQPA